MKSWKRNLIVFGVTLALLELGSYLLVSTGWFENWSSPGILEMNREASFGGMKAFLNQFDLRRTRRGSLAWSDYTVPAIRLPAFRSKVDQQPEFLVNKFRRAKLNDDPRDNEPIDHSEYLILFTGNSTGLGLGASRNSRTIAAVVQAKLREKLGAKVRVLNYCVPDFKFTDEVLSFIMRWSYIKPDLWLSMNGDNDSSSENQRLPADIKYLVRRRHFARNLYASTFYFLPNFQLLMGIINSNHTQAEVVSDLMASAEPETFRTDEEIYLQNVRMAASLASEQKIPFVQALQPIMWVDSHKPTLAEETSALHQHELMGVRADGIKGRTPTYKKFYENVRAGVEKLRLEGALPGNTKFLNLDHVFDPAGDQIVYRDTKHYNDLGQRLLGEQLADLLLPTVKAGMGRKFR